MRGNAMSRITVSASVRQVLEQIDQPVELCDEAGNLLGRFLPKFDSTKYEWLSPEISEEELERRENSRERRYTTAEVIAHLENL
jgi:hypothetical protein